LNRLHEVGRIARFNRLSNRLGSCSTIQAQRAENSYPHVAGERCRLRAVAARVAQRQYRTAVAGVADVIEVRAHPKAGLRGR